MAISSIGSSGAPSGNTVNNKLGNLKSEDFIKMMITQLQNQDPMEPAKSDQLLAQMSQIGQLQASTTLTDSLKTMVVQNQIGAASSLIGKIVKGMDATNETVTGMVNSVRVEGDKVKLELDNGNVLDMSQVTQIAPGTAAAAPVAAAQA
jgi:flagellar basal-body rod modification protein FlgD